MESGIISDVGCSVHSYYPALDSNINAETMLTADSLEKTLTGSVSINETQWALNKAGDKVGVGAVVTRAGYYNYHYVLTPGDTNISAREGLDVDSAEKIDAYAEARSADGHVARSGISMAHGSLHDYTNWASVCGGSVAAGQRFSRADGDTVRPETSGSDGYATAGADTAVLGAIVGYSDRAETSIGSPKAHIEQFGQAHRNPSMNGSFVTRSYFS